MIQEIQIGPGLQVIRCMMDLVSVMKCPLALWLNFKISCDEEYRQYRSHCGTESEHQVLNGSHIFISFTRILVLFGTKFQYSRKSRKDEEVKQSDKAAIRELVLTFCPTVRCYLQRKLKLLCIKVTKCPPTYTPPEDKNSSLILTWEINPKQRLTQPLQKGVFLLNMLHLLQCTCN